MYLLKRVSDGKFVAKDGSISSYTMDITNVKIFPTREAAERNRCGENEIIVPIEDLMEPTDRAKYKIGQDITRRLISG